MKAAVIHGAKNLRIDEVPEPGLARDEVRVRVVAGGICGSDLSYFNKGRVGDFALREPMILGHEVSGEIVELGPGASGLTIGQRIAIDPSRPCRICSYCRAGRSNLCAHMRFYGSAAIMPHVQGAFSETVVARVDQCHVLPDNVSWAMGAMAEPLSVALHAVRRAGEVHGRRVLIAGAGPIGNLVALAARQAGAAHVTVFDIADPPLEVVARSAADETINTARQPELLADYERDKGWFDVGFEATGAPPALTALFKVVRPGGRIVQIGGMPPGDIPVPANVVMAQEIDFVGSFRFHEEFAVAVEFLAKGLIDVSEVLTDSIPFLEAGKAFELAGDRSRSLKVQLVF